MNENINFFDAVLRLQLVGIWNKITRTWNLGFLLSRSFGQFSSIRPGQSFVLNRTAQEGCFNKQCFMHNYNITNTSVDMFVIPRFNIVALKHDIFYYMKKTKEDTLRISIYDVYWKDKMIQLLLHMVGNARFPKYNNESFVCWEFMTLWDKTEKVGRSSHLRYRGLR